jgi:hypothetical protein
VPDPDGVFLGPGWPLVGYVGLGPGDLLPYFAALASVVAAALVAIVQWPLVLAIRWLKGKGGDPHSGDSQAAATDGPSPPDESGSDAAS